ncbi:MAG: hypothetical protein IKB61_04185, partial [Elusimicrobiaceae bacterium]|nr:hypothetical protein [Elusimicrobiaceae bacterium]
MNRNIKIFCLGGLGLLLSGCIASERDMGTLKLQLKELNDTIAVMQVNQAELASKMEELNQNLSVSNENLSQLDAQIFNLSAKLDDINVAVKSGQSGAENTGEQKVLLPSDIFNEAKNHLNKHFATNLLFAQIYQTYSIFLAYDIAFWYIAKVFSATRKN